MECFRNHRHFSSSLWINNEVIHIYILSYTCEVLFFLIHNEQTVKILNIDCFLSSHYQTETRSNKLHAAMRQLLTQWGIQYPLSCYLMIQWTQTLQNLSVLWYTQTAIPVFSWLYIPYIVLLIPESGRRLSHNVSVSSELILKYFGWRSDDLRPQ